jgi:hypothetical protein
MIEYVIKNKEGKYRAGAVKNFSGFFYYTDKLVQAEFFNDYELAKCYCSKDCEIVKVTITEGDLEQDIKLDNAFWKQECDSLQETLAEKYKEIEELKTFNAKNIYDTICHALNMQEKQIRKQICDEFKKAIITESIFDTEEEARHWTDDIDVKTILKIIEKIEQGEEV